MRGPGIPVIVIIILIVGGMFLFLKESAECSEAGGQYVRKVSGLYTCIVGGRELE
jgi:hypothetical protein